MINFIRRAEKFYKVAIILIDLIFINLAYIIAFLIKFRWSLPDFNFNPYMEIAPFITIAALVYFDVFGLLKFYRKTLYETISSIVTVVFILSITTVAIAYFNQGFSFPRSVLLTAPVFQFILLALWKSLILYLRRLITHEMRLMVIGDRYEMNSVINKVDHALRNANLNIKYVIPTDEIDKAIKRLKDVDEVLICAGVSDEQKMKIISQCLASKKVVYIVPQLFEISLFNARMVQFEDVPAFMIDRLGLTVEQRFFKRAFDIVISFIGIIVTLPVMAAASCLVKLTSRGPVIYSQVRLTDNNRTFDIYKFRTMYEGAENKTGPIIAGEDDPRITKAGKILRKLRIDELPQLFNVLMGDMSFVGPRPERPFFVEQFSKDIPEYRHRYLVKAGITGYAQVLGKYDTSPEDKLRYDLLYIKNYSLLLDIKLILQTVKVVLGGSGIYQGSVFKNKRYLKERKKAANF